MLIRPGDFIEDLNGLPIYLCVITLAILLNFDKILAQLRWSVIRTRPMLAAVIGVFCSVIMSHVLWIRRFDAQYFGDAFGRIVLFYLLYTGIVTTKPRIKTMMKGIAFFAILEVGMAVADYDGYYDFESINAMSEPFMDSTTGILTVYMRMCGTGLFDDPNDLCMLITVGIMMCLYFMTRNFFGIIWAVPIGFLVYALTLTHSRGGLMALVSAVVAFLVARFGWRKTFPLVLVVVPAILFMGGRQTAITTTEGTGQGRVQLWAYGFSALISERAPFFGIGAGYYAEYAGLVAHNSYVQAYVETGFVGGTCFFTLFYFGIRNLVSIKKFGADIVDPELLQIQPYLIGMMTGVAVSMMSLTRNLVVPVYLFCGLTECYLNVIAGQFPFLVPQLDKPQIKKIVRASAIAFVSLYLYTRLNARFGGG